MSAQGRYQGQRLLRCAIVVYRRFLSGRGPLRRVACTFGHTESCSAYGLRAVDDIATSLPQALRLIRARLLRCGGATLYALPGAGDAHDAPDLLWGEDLDRDPAELDAELRAAGEKASTRALVLRARAMVARHSGDMHELQRCVARARSLTAERSRLVMRRGAGVVRALHGRLARRLAWAALMLAVLALCAPAWLALVGGVIMADLAWPWSCRQVRRARRMDRLLAANRFRRPVAVPLRAR